MLFNGVIKTINATIPNVLNNIPVVSVPRPMSSTFNGKPKARVPLLYIRANAALEDKIINGCLSNGKKSLNVNLPRSVVTNDSFTKNKTIKAMIKRSEEHTSELQSRVHLV